MEKYQDKKLDQKILKKDRSLPRVSTISSVAHGLIGISRPSEKPKITIVRKK